MRFGQHRFTMLVLYELVSIAGPAFFESENEIRFMSRTLNLTVRSKLMRRAPRVPRATSVNMYK